MPDLSPPKKMLVIRLGAMGDLIHASGAARVFKTHYPNTELHWLTSPAYTELLSWVNSNSSVIDQVHAWQPQKGFSFWPDLWQLTQRLKPQQFDAVVNLHPSLKTNLLIYLLGIPKVYAYKKQKLAVTGFEERPILRRHAVQDFYKPFETGFNLPTLADATPIPKILYPVLNFKTEVALPTILSIALIPGVGAKRSNRAWPLHHYQTLIQQVSEQFHQPITWHIIGGPDEQPLAQELIEGVVKNLSSIPLGVSLQNHCGKTTLRDTATILKTCTWAIGGDTGPMHLAAALGVPTISLFGPTSTKRTGVLNLQETSSEYSPTQSSLACWPCEAPICHLQGSEHLACLNSISPKHVLQQLLPSHP